ncbi:heterokaryon incompatibility protein-domain-containing protein [Cubamyces lactineus]|nr:heterokaryon incompatibility protein-domain-containing protein [Cubamyces lactineus]
MKLHRSNHYHATPRSHCDPADSAASSRHTSLLHTANASFATELPPRPPNICASAWAGVFAAHFGLFLAPVESRSYQGALRWLRRARCLWAGGYVYTVSPTALFKCADSGCLWCRIVADLFPKKLTESSWGFKSLMHRAAATIRVGTYDARESIRKTLTLFIGVDGCSYRLFKIYTTQDDPAAPWIDGRMRIPHVGDPRVLSLAKALIEECVRDHVHCQAVTQHPIGLAPLPSRLIDCSHPLFPRLVETTCHNVREPYVAFSYVWGMAQPHRTTMDNLASYISLGIDYTTLPRTIRDAIYVTRALGLRFLWIDSLCIIQDSQEDMDRELARMRDIYRYAYLTIDAACATSVSKGFLRNQRPLDPERMLPFLCPRSPLDQPAGNAPVGVIYIAPPNFDNVYGSALSDLVTKADLPEDRRPPTTHTAARAWCLQEVLMSTRILVFTSETVQLRCHTQTRNVGGARHNPAWDLPRLPDATFLPDRQVARGSDEWNHIRSRWRSIVEDYTNRLLSNPSDRLVAISGLAEMFAQALGSEYVAGLWRDTLLHDLLWSRYGSKSPPSSPRPLEHYAPSWSWGSIDELASYDLNVNRPDLHALAEVVECSVTLRNKNLPFGPVTRGSLILRTPLFPCKWAGLSKLGVQQVAIDAIQEAQHTVIVGRSAQYSSSAPGVHVVGTIAIDRDEDSALQALWVIPLEHRNATYVHGLVITRAEPGVWTSARPEGSREVYRRVGLYSISDREHFPAHLIVKHPLVEIELV